MEMIAWNLRHQSLVEKKPTHLLLDLQSGCPQAGDPPGVGSPSRRRLPFTQSWSGLLPSWVTRLLPHHTSSFPHKAQVPLQI